MAAANYILDSNVLTLAVVGSINPDGVSVFKRTNMFDATHALRLLDLLDSAASLLVTPAVVAETSNLLNAANGPTRASFYRALSLMLARVIEVYTPSMELCADPRFALLGVTDVGLLQSSCERSAVILTADARMIQFTRWDQGERAINFWNQV